MRIKRVECDQFAGLTGKELQLEKGLNIVVGENESGKSTIVDLIYQLLFKDAKLDGRRDSDYIEKYFPKKASGPEGDVIDGVLVFETPSGTYKLKKEWEKGTGTGSSRLILPDGTSLKGMDAINNILKEELKYRAGVYNEIVFASQKRNSIAVESIMRALGKKTNSLSDARDDLISTLTQASLETGGVSLEKTEKSIKEKMNALIGRWDLDADAPEGGPKRASYKNPWAKDAGAIAKAYYEVDEVRSRQAGAEEAERDVESEKAKIHELQARKKEAETARNAFQKYRGLLGQRSLLTGSIQDLEEKTREQNAALARWPGLGRDIAKARDLQEKRRQAHIHELYLKAEPVRKSYLEKQAEFEKNREVDAADIKSAAELQRARQKEESRLAGMNLAAKIRKLGQTEIKVTSAVSGEVLDLTEGEVQITEAVNIVVPGILDLQLMPKGVDVEAVKQRLESINTAMKSIYGKYEVDSLDELQTVSEAYTGAKRDVETAKTDLERILGDVSWEEIKAANDRVRADIETEAEIKRKMDDLCGEKTVDAFIGGLESTLSEYESRYQGMEELKESIENLKHDSDEKQKQLDSMDRIPEEYRRINDPEQYDAGLQAEIEDCENQISFHSEKLRAAERKLGDKSAEEYSDELQEKEAVLSAQKAEYGHWQKIYKVFCELKEKSGGNPVEDIELRFREYLKVITDGKLQLNSMDNQMSVQLTSGSHKLTYDILSDGTKDAVSLAFRLAMLEHLYPEGDGLVIFDDPFTDMDPKRVKQSCSLIQKFAEKNQVIFITCDGKYKGFMTGNVIEVTMS